MFLLIDKPKGITSHDVVDKVRQITGEQKVGHAGTLDPNATGLLIVGIGRESTKQLGDLAKNTDKTYVAEIILGEERDTEDVEGKVTAKYDLAESPSKEWVGEVIASFLGEQEQIPPAHSAIKIKGKKAYELARQGKEVNIEPRRIIIHSIKVIDFTFPSLKLLCNVSSGTYIRSLARDIGKRLGTGAYLSQLRRTKIGKCEVDSAIDLENISSTNWKQLAKEHI